MSDIERAIEHFKATQEDYLEARDYFEGTVPEKFSSERLKRALANSQLNPVLNFARTPVNAVANRLELTAVAAEDKRSQEFIDDLWESNDLEVESDDAHLWSLVYGDGYLMVWPDDDDDDGSYTINYNTPLTTALFYDEENPRRKRYAAKMWQYGEYTRMNLYYPGVVIKLISKSKDKVREANDLKPFIDDYTDEDGFMDSPFDFIPVYHLRTRKPYGSPEHKAAYGAQDLITKNVISQMVANDFHGLPQRYVLEETGDNFNLDDDDEPDLTAGAGDVWWLRNIKEVGQFDSAEPASYLEPFKEYIRAMATLTDTPLHHFEAGFSAPSGESLRVAESPLVKKVRTRQTVFGGAWRALISELLAHAGLQPDVTVSWAPAETQSDIEMWEQVVKMQEAGVSLENALRFGTNLDETAILKIVGTQVVEDAA